MPKVVVLGAVNGKPREVFSKLAALHAKNAFAVAIIAGDLFADTASSSTEDEQQVDDLLAGRVDIPLSTYFTLGHQPLPPKVIERLKSNDGELCANLYFLGKRTTIKTSDGIRVVALGGVIDPALTVAASRDEYTPFASIGDANTLKGANTADILITHHWPTNIEVGSKLALPTATPQAASTSPSTTPPPHTSIAELSARLKPRYHFSTSSTFYEREPFFHAPPNDAKEKGYATTRFISLAPFGNPNKQKWIYAFTLDPSVSAPLTVPAGTTASPFAFLASENAKRALPSQAQQFSRFAQTDGSGSGGTHSHDRHGGHRGKRAKHHHASAPPDPSTCFFCLSSPTLSAHLVVSIGTEAYLTTARGPLPTSSTFSPFLEGSANDTKTPLHILIIPMSHTPVLSSIPPPSHTATIREMHAYRRALNIMLTAKSGGRLGSVCWEVSRAGGVHAHWQYCAVDAELVGKGLVDAGMRVEAENQGFAGFWAGRTLVEGDGSEDAEAVDDEQGDFFRVWSWRPSTPASNGDATSTADETGDAAEKEGEGTTKTLVLPLPNSEDKRFDLQFGRRVLAKLMGLEARISWRECGQTEGEEGKDAEAFKALFKGFDFTLEDGGGGEEGAADGN